MVGLYQNYVVAPDVDHMVIIRRITRDQKYEEIILNLARFQEELVLYMEEKIWVLDFFGKLYDLGAFNYIATLVISSEAWFWSELWAILG